MYNLGIFIFRRDLRLEDNYALDLLSSKCDLILPIFILDSNQIEINNKNKYYFSNNAVQYICESLIDLNDQLNDYQSRLRLFYGIPWTILADILTNLNKKYKSIAIGFNSDFSNYSIKRDHAIKVVCDKLNIDIINSDDDLTLRPIKELIKEDGGAFKQYGAFYSNAIKKDPLKAIKYKYNNFINKIKLEKEYDIKDLDKLYEKNELIAQHGGRSEALLKLNSIKKFKNYNDMRDMLSYETTHLSAALNMGCISIRETYWKIRKILGIKSTILKQLYWRDFYLCAFIYLENAKSYKVLMDSRYELIKWKITLEQKIFWKKMIDGKTGFLLIDAGINEMKTTGFLHNRCRMILGVFWTKYLQIHIHNPKYGSQCGFSKYLVDAIGPTQNKMNHHWILDFDYPGKKFSAPNAPLSGRPMNISNLMIKKWDSECLYIKKWIPELKDVSNKDIYKWSEVIAKKYNNIHPAPMFDEKKQYKKWIDMCYGIK